MSSFVRGKPTPVTDVNRGTIAASLSELKHPKPEDFVLTEIFKALSDPVRLEIVVMASKEDNLPCKAFAESIPKSSMSHHWRVLREAGLLRTVKSGTRRLNSLRFEELNKRFPGLIEVILASAER